MSSYLKPISWHRQTQGLPELYHPIKWNCNPTSQPMSKIVILNRWRETRIIFEKLNSRNSQAVLCWDLWWIEKVPPTSKNKTAMALQLINYISKYDWLCPTRTGIKYFSNNPGWLPLFYLMHFKDTLSCGTRPILFKNIHLLHNRDKSSLVFFMWSHKFHYQCLKILQE